MIKSGITNTSMGWPSEGRVDERSEMVSSTYALVLGMSKYILNETPTSGRRLEAEAEDGDDDDIFGARSRRLERY